MAAGRHNESNKSGKIPFAEKKQAENLPQKEGRLLGAGNEDVIRHLAGKISILEKELSAAKKERDRALIQNKEEIKRVAETISKMKSIIHQAVQEKKHKK